MLGLGDASLAALAVGCPQLESFVVGGVWQVAATGLLLLLLRVEKEGPGAG